jgi:hypothetical protein
MRQAEVVQLIMIIFKKIKLDPKVESAKLNSKTSALPKPTCKELYIALLETSCI